MYVPSQSWTVSLLTLVLVAQAGFHLCVQHDRRGAARRAGPSATAATCYLFYPCFTITLKFYHDVIVICLLSLWAMLPESKWMNEWINEMNDVCIRTLHRVLCCTRISTDNKGFILAGKIKKIKRRKGRRWPALCFILVYNCSLTVRNKQICYVMLWTNQSINQSRFFIVA